MKSSLIPVALLAGFAQGQEPTNNDKKFIPLKWNSVSIGYSTWEATGSGAQLRRFGRPPEGLNLRETAFVTSGTKNRPYSALSWRGTPDQDSIFEGRVVLNGKTKLKFQQELRGYQNEGPITPLESEDRVTKATLEQAITSDLAAYVVYRSDHRDQRFAPYRDQRESRSMTYAAGLSGNALGGKVDLLVSTHRYKDERGAQPDTLQRRIEGSYATEIGSSISLEGRLGSTRIEQSGRADGHVRTLAIAGDIELTPRTWLHLAYGREDYDLSGVQSATLRQRTQASVRAVHRIPGWTFQAGMRVRDVERKAKGPMTHEPGWTSYDARVIRRFGTGRLVLRGTWDSYRGAPDFDFTRPGRTVWDDKSLLQAKVDGSFGPVTAYASVSRRRQANGKSGLSIEAQSVALGASATFGDSLVLFGELSHDAIRTRGSDVLGVHFPSATNAGFGLDWTVDGRQSLSAGLNLYNSRDLRGQQVTVQYRRQLSADDSIELYFAPWRHEDRLTGLFDASTSFFGVALTRKF